MAPLRLVVIVGVELALLTISAPFPLAEPPPTFVAVTVKAVPGAGLAGVVAMVVSVSVDVRSALVVTLVNCDGLKLAVTPLGKVPILRLIVMLSLLPFRPIVTV